ncbi:excisionase family DNA-binding protein [Acidipropionibacterium jensenii]|uniref:excisionase family DNA-binding protein n=1 Tax=Acidipropionibacterium jensenii TaxID=1749 RepID=UPI00214B1697|nr:excisionase family DNA-binding protein [Acidipropionibacterium jensenii]
MPSRSHLDEETVEPVFISLSQAGQMIGYSLDTIHRRIAEGRLPVFQDGRLRRVRPADVLALLEPVDPQGFAHAGRRARR